MSFFEPKRYVKDESFDRIYSTVNLSFFVRSRILPVVFPSFGILVFITQILIPFIALKTSDSISRPISQSILGVATGFGAFEFTELKDDAVLGISTSANANVPKYYYLTIPKLDIFNAKVETNPVDLSPDEALGHYPGSALPGEIGNAFIYGHSALPIFYNPKNYKAIFSKLGDLEAGDTFTIIYNNKSYVYAVERLRTLKPNEVNPLAEIKPRYLNESTAVLMTCTPPGTKINRLLVEAVLME